VPDQDDLDTGLPRFARLLNDLLEAHRKPNGKRYSDQEIATWCAENGATSFSRTYVWMLRTGRREKPTFEHVEALARFFSVPTEYFGDSDYSRTLQHEVELLQALQNTSARQMALRGAGLSPENARKVLAEIDRIRDEQMRKADDGADAEDADPEA
jgi:transcriptional regulator with XRE-family HTH domain